MQTGEFPKLPPKHYVSDLLKPSYTDDDWDPQLRAGAIAGEFARQFDAWKGLDDCLDKGEDLGWKDGTDPARKAFIETELNKLYQLMIEERDRYLAEIRRAGRRCTQLLARDPEHECRPETMDAHARSTLRSGSATWW